MKCNNCGSTMALLTVKSKSKEADRRTRYSYACYGCNHREYSEIESLLRYKGVIYLNSIDNVLKEDNCR